MSKIKRIRLYVTGDVGMTDAWKAFAGTVVDRLTKAVLHKSQKRATWESAQKAAESAAKRKGYRGDRYAVRVYSHGDINRRTGK